MKLLAVPKYQQTTDYSCGPACLKMVLAYYGVEALEQDIADLVGARRRHGTEPQLGTSPAKLRRGALTLGLRGRWSRNSSINDLNRAVAKGTPVIVSWFSHDDGHYSVVIGVDDKQVILLDPEDGEKRTLSHEVFMRVWFDFPSPHIRYRHHLRIRWMLPLTLK